MAAQTNRTDVASSKARERIEACRKAGALPLDFEAQLAKLALEADAAIVEEDFETAASLQEQADKLYSRYVPVLSGLGLTTLPPEISQLTTLTTLSLTGNQLSNLPPEIGHLKNLRTLDLSANKFTTLPPEIGQLTALTTLSLVGNQLSNLPPEIGRLTALTTLSLRANELTFLPQEIGQLAALTKLDLRANELLTLPSEIGQLAALTTLDLSANDLTHLPPEMGRLTSLTTLSLHLNELKTLPVEIGQLTALTTLYLHNNQVRTLPCEIGQLTALTTLNLSNNKLTTLPPEIGKLTALTTFSIHHNRLTTLPCEIGQLTALTKFELSDNQLTMLPSEIGRLTGLTKLHLDINQVTTLPPEIGQLATLASLSLSNNQLSSLPDEIGGLTALTTLCLSNNQLTKLPQGIGKLSGLTGLDLRYNRLTTVPCEIGQLTALTILELHNNRIESLPPDIGKLSALQTLDLSNNKLTAIPCEIGRLTALTKLYLSNNQLATLPPEIGQLTALTTLYLPKNKLETLPEEIGQLASLTMLDLRNNELLTLPARVGQLTALTKLYLSTNQLTTLPPQIGQLGALTKLDLCDNQLTMLPGEIGQLLGLTALELRDNQLTTLPGEIGRLTALKRLDVRNNQLTTLPQEISQLAALTSLDFSNNQLSTLPVGIGQLVALTTLYLSNNKLTTLPHEVSELTVLTTLGLRNNQLTTVDPDIRQLRCLKTLDLANNQLTTLPEEICELTSLTTLYLHGNPGLMIPDSILGPTITEVQRQQLPPARPQDILNFYFAQRKAAAAGTLRPVNEIKVMLVGRGGAGKTSLRRFFMGQPHDRQEKETPGIALDRFSLSCTQGELTVRLWDFAGQEITHALHKFFLTEGCVYVLVLDPRSNTEMHDAEYWLGLLKRYAPSAPVLVALNRQDERQGGYDVDRRVLKERFPNIQSFTPTNCEKREGCDKLRERLREAVESLKDTEPPHLKVPETWLRVMEDCAGEAREQVGTTGNRQYLTLDEFRAICAKRGEHDPAKQESLARLLHRLGAVLHFVDEPRLRDTAVLNPHWVTDGVYRLLRFKDGPRSDGTLTLAEALAALPGEKEEDARFLLRLMERFEMCFPLDEAEGKLPTKWLIPGALGEFQPEGVTADWQKPGSVRLRYVYDPLPEGVLPRFITMTHLLSEGKPRWRNGVVLEDGRAAALVRRGEKRNYGEVTAFGPDADRLRLLEIIQGTLDRIHLDLPDPKPVAEMELAGLPGVFRSVADLEAAEQQKVVVAVKTASVEARVEPTLQLNLASEPEARTNERIPLHAFLSYSHADKQAKAIFQQNLTVMMKKRLIAPWHDGLIEPGTLWREEIEKNLAEMDVFIGLLTTAFLASEFIEKVELRTGREKLRGQGKDFVFVLIQVEDGVSIDGLETAGYQILRPGGKAVSRHKNRREGFNVAQQELERLILKQQAEKKHRQRDEIPFPQRTPSREQDGHSSKLGGRVGRTLMNCTTLIQEQAPGERKNLLETLASDVRELIESLPADRHKDASKIADRLEKLIAEVAKEEPEQEWYLLSVRGLLEPASGVKDFSGKIGATVLNLGKMLWPGFQLPG